MVKINGGQRNSFVLKPTSWISRVYLLKKENFVESNEDILKKALYFGR